MRNAANYTQAANEPAPTKLLITKREIAERYSIGQRSIDLLRERGLPWVSYSARKILFNVKECDAWFEKYAIRAPRKPSEYQPRIPTATPAN